MKVSRRRLPAIAAGVVGLGAALAFALPAGAAVSTQSAPAGVLALGANATLDANGAVVFAPVKVGCRPGSTASLAVTVTENVNDVIASGTYYGNVTCDGGQQKLRVAVVPTQRAFKKGVAFGQATLMVCGDSGCQGFADQHSIQIVKK